MDTSVVINVAPCLTFILYEVSILNKSTEWSNARAWSNHDHRYTGLERQTELWFSYENRHGGLQTICWLKMLNLNIVLILSWKSHSPQEFFDKRFIMQILFTCLFEFKPCSCHSFHVSTCWCIIVYQNCCYAYVIGMCLETIISLETIRNGLFYCVHLSREFYRSTLKSDTNTYRMH